MPSLCWAHLKETKEIWSTPVLPCTVHGRAAHCLWSHQAFKNGQEARKEVRVFFPWGPAQRADHPLPLLPNWNASSLSNLSLLPPTTSSQCYLRLHREETILSTPTPWKCWRKIKHFYAIRLDREMQHAALLVGIKELLVIEMLEERGCKEWQGIIPIIKIPHGSLSICH